MVKAAFFMICLTFVVPYAVKCDPNCDSLGILLYEDLGCRPITKPGKECPIKYECDDFTRLKDSCLFRGRKYALYEEIDKDITYESCNIGCSCSNHIGSSLNTGEVKDIKISTKQFLLHACRSPPSAERVGVGFTCAVLDCPEWLGVPVKPGCYRKYEVNKCCSVGQICPSEDSPVGECAVDGKTYREGEKFFPKNTCMKCVCPKSFDGKLEPPSCKRISCGVQINHVEELHNMCAPCYMQSAENSLCCPDTWICPSPNEIIKSSGGDSDSELKCRYGDKEMKLGESFQKKINYYGSDAEVKCECVVPPLMTCKRV